MNLLFKVMLLMLTLVLLIQCEKDEPYPHVKISDNNFLYALIESGVDTNRDGKISHAEAEAITILNVNEKGISDLTGIKAFVNLDFLSCSHNQLTTMDLSNNTALTKLDCYDNQLTNLNVSNNTELVSLVCWINQLASLDVSNNTALKWLYCDNN